MNNNEAPEINSSLILYPNKLTAHKKAEAIIVADNLQTNLKIKLTKKSQGQILEDQN